MNVGEKIRSRRLELGLTQKEVAADRITRSMLSEIESGDALPSLTTLVFLAEKLSVKPGYLIDEERTLAGDVKQKILPTLWQLYREGKYTACIEKATEEPALETDPDIAYLLACASLGAAEECVEGGSIKTAIKHLEKFNEYAACCIYDTAHLRARAELCNALAVDPLTPKYVLNTKQYNDFAKQCTNEELYHYLLEEVDYTYTTPLYRDHMEAKRLMRDHYYTEAIAKLNEIVNNRFAMRVSVLLLYRIYSDLETCYRERGDYENAYKCSSKKNVLLTSLRN